MIGIDRHYGDDTGSRYSPHGGLEIHREWGVLIGALLSQDLARNEDGVAL